MIHGRRGLRTGPLISEILCIALHIQVRLLPHISLGPDKQYASHMERLAQQDAAI